MASIVYDTPFSSLTMQNALFIADNYAETLESFVQRGIQRKWRSKHFDDRADACVLLMVRHCHRLGLLALRERVSTASLLLVAHFCSYKTSFHLCVRRNAVLKRSDWPHNQKEWTGQFYQWLKDSARDYDRALDAMQNLLGKTVKMMSDSEYKHFFGRKEK